MCGKAVGCYGPEFGFGSEQVFGLRRRKGLCLAGVRCIGFGSVLTCRNSGPVFPKSDTSEEAENPALNVKITQILCKDAQLKF